MLLHIGRTKEPAMPDALSRQPIGSSTTIRAVAGEAHVRRRLFELGLVPGTQVSIVRRAPLGDPLELSLRGYRLSLRSVEAALIAVEG
jgi:Fe2+ transport system protein FeoA